MTSHRWKFSLRHFPVLGILAAIALAAHADEPLQVKLVCAEKSIQPGRPFYLGLQLHHGSGYHTYWKHPGVVGVPTSINWYLPEGFTAAEIEWPAPERVFMYKIAAQGFERNVILPIRITPPQKLTNTVIKIEGRSGWMSCAKRCSPGHTSVAIELPVSATTPEPDEIIDPLIKAELSRVAVVAPDWNARAVERGTNIVLTLIPAGDRARKPAAHEATNLSFFTCDGYIRSDTEHPRTIDTDGSITFTLPISDIFLGDKPPTHLNAILRNESGWLTTSGTVSIEIHAPIERR